MAIVEYSGSKGDFSCADFKKLHKFVRSFFILRDLELCVKWCVPLMMRMCAGGTNKGIYQSKHLTYHHSFNI